MRHCLNCYNRKKNNKPILANELSLLERLRDLERMVQKDPSIIGCLNVLAYARTSVYSINNPQGKEVILQLMDTFLQMPAIKALQGTTPIDQSSL